MTWAGHRRGTCGELCRREDTEGQMTDEDYEVELERLQWEFARLKQLLEEHLQICPVADQMRQARSSESSRDRQ
jgi:hypothetical protein